MSIVSVLNKAATAVGLWDVDRVYHVARGMGGTMTLIPDMDSQQVLTLLESVGSLQTTISLDPVCVQFPSISGDPQVGETLTADLGEWVGANTLTVQWQMAGLDVAGANEITYVPVVGDIGKVASVVVTAVGDTGSESVESDTFGPIVG